MKQLLISTLFLFTFSLSLFSQKVTWSPKTKKAGSRSLLPTQYVGHDDEFYYINGFDKETRAYLKHGGILIKFNDKHQEVSRTKLEFKKHGKNLVLQEILNMSDNNFAYLYGYDGDKDVFEIYKSKLENGTLLEPELIYEKEMEDYSGALHNRHYYNLFYLNSEKTIVTSPSKNKALFTSYSKMNLITRGRSELEFNIAVFDGKLNKLWDKTQNFKYKNNATQLIKTIVSDNGDVYVLIKTAQKEKGKSDEKHVIFHVTENSMYEYEVELPNNNYPLSLAMTFDYISNQIMIGGNYTDDIKSEKAKGFYFGSIENTLKNPNLKIHPFTEKILNKANNSKTVKDKHFKYPLIMRYIATHDNGNFSLLVEHSYNKMTHEILMPYFNSKGELLNMELVKKEYDATNIDYGSFIAHFANSKIYLVFTDQLKENNLKNPKGLSTHVCVIGEDGNIVNRKFIFSKKDVGLHFMPRFSFSIKNRLMLWCAELREFKIGELIID